jgi:hypothetical protein
MTKAATLVAVTVAMLGSASAYAQSTAERGAPSASAATSGRSCESLASLALPNAKITSAELVAAGAFKGPNAGRGFAVYAQLPAFCRVAATLTPAPESDIKMEIWLPAENWNGKFLAVGNGGWAGTISLDAVANGLRRGYAAASNDTGHSDAGAQFALKQDKLIDFAYRAMHEMTVQSKSIVGAFYSRPPRLSYYQGCSTGGRQGMMEAQRYPDDFDAIIAGAPVYRVADGAPGAHVEEPGAYRSAEQGHVDRQCRNRRLRRKRRRQGRHHQRPPFVQVRSRNARMQSGRPFDRLRVVPSSVEGRGARLLDLCSTGDSEAVLSAGQDEVR